MNATINTKEDVKSIEDAVKLDPYLNPKSFVGYWTEEYSDYPQVTTYAAQARGSMGRVNGDPTVSKIYDGYKIALIPGTPYTVAVIHLNPFFVRSFHRNERDKSPNAIIGRRKIITLYFVRTNL